MTVRRSALRTRSARLRSGIERLEFKVATWLIIGGALAVSAGFSASDFLHLVQNRLRS